MHSLLRVAAALVAGCVLASCSDDGLAVGEFEVIGAADEGVAGVQAIRVGDNTHTEAAIEYQLQPPAGGAHNPVWANCGFYEQAIPDENLVHDLEHGAVWLAYSPDLPDSDLEVLRAITRSSAKVIATPYPGLDSAEAVVATAWARQLRLDSVDAAQLSDFVVTYLDGGQAPEPGGPCTGGIGAPGA